MNLRDRLGKWERREKAVFAVIILFLSSAVYWGYQHYGSLSNAPWKTGKDFREYNKNRDEYIQLQLKTFNQNFPEGSDVRLFELRAIMEGYLTSLSCSEKSLQNVPEGGDCLCITKPYPNYSQSFDIVYDKNHKIVSMHMGFGIVFIDN